MSRVYSRPRRKLAEATVAGVDRVDVAELIAMRALAPRLRATRAMRSAGAGGHASPLHARGVDYAESRVYQPGDDIRAMDWRVTARSGTPHTKLYREERERALVLLVDGNASMRFGTRTRFKSVQAARAAALAAWMAVRQGDRVGLVGFGGMREIVRPHAGPRGALRVIGALARGDGAADATIESLADGLRRCARSVPAGARVLVVSDGFSADADARSELLRLRRRAEIRLLLVADAVERAAPDVGAIGIAHAGTVRLLALRDATVRRDFERALGRGRRVLGELAQSCALRLVEIDTSVSPLAALGVLLDARHGRAR